MKNRLTYDVDAASLARLLALGTDDAPDRHAFDARAAAMLLRDTLDAPFMIVSADGAGWNPVPAGGTTQTILDQLIEVQPDVESLKTILSNAKHIDQMEVDESARAVANIIYFSAIASARVRLQASITSQSDDRLYVAFSNLVELDWLDVRLRELLNQARIICKANLGH